MPRGVGIYSIFERNENKTYTKDALLYQDILSYSLNIEKDELGDSKPFRHWDLASWLMNHNEEFVNRYKKSFDGHTNISNRIENTQKRTKGVLLDLIALGLIDSAGIISQRKGTGIVNLYKFTWEGFLFAWLIEGIKPEKREYVNDEIFNLFDSYFKRRDNGSVDIYNSNLYNTFKNKGVFGEIVVDTIREKIASSNARNIDEFFQHSLLFISAKDDEKRKIFLESWKQTMDELDPQTKKLTMYDFKLNIESKMKERVLIGLDTFENMRFDLRDRYDRVMLTGNCNKCHGVFIGNAEMLKYIEAYNSSSSHNTGLYCKRCHTGKIILEKPF
jgi:hypothetical protein